MKWHISATYPFHPGGDDLVTLLTSVRNIQLSDGLPPCSMPRLSLKSEVLQLGWQISCCRHPFGGGVKSKPSRWLAFVPLPFIWRWLSGRQFHRDAKTHGRGAGQDGNWHWIPGGLFARAAFTDINSFLCYSFIRELTSGQRGSGDRTGSGDHLTSIEQRTDKLRP